MKRQTGWQRIVASLLIASGFALAALTAAACPFCSAVKTTITEDVEASDVAALAELVERPERPDAGEGEIPAADIIDSYKTQFRIVKVYRGGQHVKVGQTAIAIYTGDAEPGALCLLRGVEAPNLEWAPPVPLSQRAQQYVEEVLQLPKEGSERLQFFEPYLEDGEELLRNDAFDEFARADYAALKGIKDRINHDRLVDWIKNPDVLASNRRLYFTMLSVCGGPEDTQMLEELIKSNDRKQMSGLDSLISCYLTLRGEEGLPLIEDRFLRGGLLWDPEYVHTYGAIMALRFQGQENDVIPRERLLASLRIMLDRPQLADLVIPDLARWEDWSSIERLVTMFKEANKETSWVRVPIVNFLRACPLPEAKQYLAELSQLDPDTVRRASTFFPYAPAPAAAAAATTGEPESTTDAAASTKDKDPAGGAAERADEATQVSDDASPQTGAQAAADSNNSLDAVARDSAEVPDSAAAAPPGAAAEGKQAAGGRSTDAGAGPPAAWVAGVPVAAALVLFCLMWFILRRPREPTTNQNA